MPPIPPKTEPRVLGPSTVRFAEVTVPGTYLSDWSGHLVRIPEDAVKPGRTPVIEILGNDAMTITKLSDNPFLTITRARMIAADHDLDINF